MKEKNSLNLYCPSGSLHLQVQDKHLPDLYHTKQYINNFTKEVEANIVRTSRGEKSKQMKSEKNFIQEAESNCTVLLSL